MFYCLECQREYAMLDCLAFIPDTRQQLRDIRSGEPIFPVLCPNPRGSLHHRILGKHWSMSMVMDTNEDGTWRIRRYYENPAQARTAQLRAIVLAQALGNAFEAMGRHLREGDTL